jgi:hypothetical protein
MAGVASMAVAIKPADKSLNLVICISPLDAESQRRLASVTEMWADARFEMQHLLTVVQRTVSRLHDD